MSDVINQIFVTGNVLENTQLIVTTPRQITVEIEDNGTDDDNNEYLNYGKLATKVVIRTDKTITITKINGKELKQPLAIIANGIFSWSKGFLWKNFELDVQDVTANIDITIQG